MGMGRPVKFDEEKLKQLKELMRLYPSLADTAAFFECGQTTVEETIRRHFDLTFREFREQNMVHTRLMLKRTALNKAKSGDNTMMIFCLKNLCGWKDKVENTHEVGEKSKKLIIDVGGNDDNEQSGEKSS